MAVKEFSIVVDTPNDGFFRPGDTLRGKVVISLENSNPFHTLKIVLFGRAKNSWNKKKDGVPCMVEAVEEYLNFEAEMNIEDSKTVEKAEYGFEYELSEGLPSSFSGVQGNIKYVVKAFLDGNAESKVTSQEFTVSSQINLNEVMEAAVPVEATFTQPLLFEDGHLHMNVKLNKTGFVGGENVFIECRFMNPSNQEVRVDLSLIKETTYFDKDAENRVFPIATFPATLVSVEGPTLKPQESGSWTGDLLRIPVLPQPLPCFQNCHIIRQHYYLAFEMDIALPNINLDGKIPLILGTVALKEPNTSGDTVDVQPAPIAKARNFQKKKAVRRDRAMTTCLVFRPDRPRLKLPEPKPESWTQPKSNPKTPPVTAGEVKMIAQDLQLTLISDTAKHAENLDTPPATPSSGHDETGKYKWPKPYIRRRQVPPEPKSDETKLPVPTCTDIEKKPPPKPARLRKSKSKQGGSPVAATRYVATDLHSAEESRSEFSVAQGHVTKETPPYPRTTADHFPVPDFSFNVSINGHRQEPIGWNVTRNTLTLKRGVLRLRE